MGLGFYTKNPVKFDLNLKNRERLLAKLFILKPPQIKLKPLSPYLRYVFLGDGDTLRIIIVSDLEPFKVEALKLVVKSFIQAIGWTIADIIVIAPGIYSFKIKLEQYHVQSVKHQRKVNQPMQEVIKKEIIKWD